MKYIIITDKLTDETFYYENKNALEEYYLFMAITLANPKRLTIWTSPIIEGTEIMHEIKSVPELFALVSKSALQEVA